MARLRLSAMLPAEKGMGLLSYYVEAEDLRPAREGGRLGDVMGQWCNQLPPREGGGRLSFEIKERTLG